MRILKCWQSVKEVAPTARGLFGPDALRNFSAIPRLLFTGLLVLHLGSSNPLIQTTAIASNNAAKISDGTSDPAEIAPPFPANGSTISVDNSAYMAQNADQSWSLSLPDADTLRFELRSGDHWSSSSWTDPATSERNEIAGQTVYPVGTQIEIAYDFMVEPGQTNSASGPGRWLVLGQMHEYNVQLSPPFAVEMVNGDHMAINIGTDNLHYVYTDPNPVQRGRYYSMNVKVKFDNNRNGFLSVWRDGTNIVDYHGPIGTGAATYWKEGIYRSSAQESIAARFRNLKITVEQ
jgi:Polysaccharide lyase